MLKSPIPRNCTGISFPWKYSHSVDIGILGKYFWLQHAFPKNLLITWFPVSAITTLLKLSVSNLSITLLRVPFLPFLQSLPVQVQLPYIFSNFLLTLSIINLSPNYQFIFIYTSNGCILCGKSIERSYNNTTCIRIYMTIQSEDPIRL